MSDDRRSIVENAVLMLLRTALEEHSGTVAKLGLRPEILPLRRTGDTQRYGSEVGVYFWSGDDGRVRVFDL